MYTTRAYGLTLQSDLKLLDSCPASSSAADVVICRDPLQSFTYENPDFHQVVVGSIPGITQVRVQQGRQITYIPEAGVDDQLLAPNILGAAMSVALMQRGMMVLHASAIHDGEGAIGFLGHAGWGKSTLATALCEQGYGWVTDDVLPVQVNDGQPTVVPSFPRAKLLPDTAIALGHNPSTMQPLNARSTKLNHRIKVDFLDTCLPLKRLYMLEWGEDNQVQPLPPVQGHLLLSHFARGLQTLTATEFQRTYFQQATQVAQQVPIARLVRQRSLKNLPDLIALLRKEWQR